METVTCEGCGEVITADAARCPVCGTTVRTELVGVPKEADPDVVQPPPADPTATPRGERRTAAAVLGIGVLAGLLLWIWVSPVWALIGFSLIALLAGVTLYM